MMSAVRGDGPLEAILFWDIDGTLLTTGKAGVPALEQALQEATGRWVQLSSIRNDGLTDFQIAARLLELCDVRPSSTIVQRVLARYEELLPDALKKRTGRVLPNVQEVLERLTDRKDVASYLLTGNTRRGGRAKLDHYGLSHYFAGGAFAEDMGDRASIAVRALSLIGCGGEAAGLPILVIGDTPHDIGCAGAIGAHALAVATGGYSLSELQSCQPWRLFGELPPPQEFLDLLAELAPPAAGATTA